jgi:hypothetical protein
MPRPNRREDDKACERGVPGFCVSWHQSLEASKEGSISDGLGPWAGGGGGQARQGPGVMTRDLPNNMGGPAEISLFSFSLSLLGNDLSEAVVSAAWRGTRGRA